MRKSVTQSHWNPRQRRMKRTSRLRSLLMDSMVQKPKIHAHRVAFDQNKHGRCRLRLTLRYIQLRPSLRTPINGPSRHDAPASRILKHGITVIRKENFSASIFWMIVARSALLHSTSNVTCFMISSRKAPYTIYRALAVFRLPKSSFQISATTTN